ncbi:MAG: hypothetical protein ACM31C_31440 [Acidobacteriota bacterium]
MGVARVLVLAVVALAACAPPRVADTPAPPIDTTRMSHAQHAGIACTACHQMGQRPGHDHKPCDTCHRGAFLAPPGPLCDACHLRITVDPLAAPLKPYPSEDVWQAEPPRFSHAKHLDAGRMEAKVGFHVTCADCHVRGEGKLARPDHAVCARCHAPEAAIAGAPPMDDCTGCHEKGIAQLRTRARLIRGDLIPFDHDRHRTDRRGGAIRCEQCHVASALATGYADHAAPAIAACVGCHDDSDRTPTHMRMRRCETCHTGRAVGLVTIAPRNHLPSTERPLDHTIAFRRDHAGAAERDAARCAACHTQMSGNAHDACDECHQTMRPADHRITWRELDHGTEAAADRDRCARCHVVEFCTSCHSQRPRSHGYAGSFTADHGPLARINLRSCMTCHQESFCAPCHSASPRR